MTKLRCSGCGSCMPRPQLMQRGLLLGGGLSEAAYEAMRLDLSRRAPTTLTHCRWCEQAKHAIWQLPGLRSQQAHCTCKSVDGSPRVAPYRMSVLRKHSVVWPASPMYAPPCAGRVVLPPRRTPCSRLSSTPGLLAPPFLHVCPSCPVGGSRPWSFGPRVRFPLAVLSVFCS